MEAESLAWKYLVSPEMSVGRLATNLQIFLKRKRIMEKEITETMEIIEIDKLILQEHTSCVEKLTTKNHRAGTTTKF